MGFFGCPTDRVGDSFNFFVRPLSKLCVSDAHLRVRKKHASNQINVFCQKSSTVFTPGDGAYSRQTHREYWILCGLFWRLLGFVYTVVKGN